MPLDRDEGGCAYAGWLLLNGNPPFTYFYDTKMPGIYYIYAFIMTIFGQTTEGIRIGVLLTVLINMFLVYKVFKKISGDSDANGLLSSAFYGMLTLDSGTLSLSGYSTHFVLTFVMLSLIFLLDALKNGKKIMFFISGLFMGLAFLTKQPAIFFVLFFLIYIIVIDLTGHVRTKDIFIKVVFYLAGATSVFLFVCLIMKINGVFDRFWFMTVIYAFKHSNVVSIGQIPGYVNYFLKVTSVFFKITFILYVLWLLLTVFFTKESHKKIFHIILFLSSAAFCTSGFYFTQHYFIIFALPISLAFSQNFNFSNEKLNKIKNPLFVFLLILLLLSQYDILFKLNPAKVSRKIFLANPFPESEEVARFIKRNTKDTDKIAIFGSEPQILFHAKRKSATGYVYFNQLMEENETSRKMQQEAIKEIEDAKPEYMVFSNVDTSWMIRRNSSKQILDWIKYEGQENYDLVGLVDLEKNSETKYVWQEKIDKRRLNEPFLLAVFKKAK
jgi:hypothetical protein